eukprot:760915-Hanusia_phi.AAC.2
MSGASRTHRVFLLQRRATECDRCGDQGGAGGRAWAQHSSPSRERDTCYRDAGRGEEVASASLTGSAQYSSIPPIIAKTFMCIDLGASKLTVSIFELKRKDVDSFCLQEVRDAGGEGGSPMEGGRRKDGDGVC